MQSLENQIWRSRLATWTKLKLYSTCIFLYGSDCWAISKMDARRIDALDQWCLRMLLGIKWYQKFVRNDDVWRLMKQSKLTAIVKSCRLTLFGHIMRMDDNADVKRILLVSLQWTGENNQVVPHHVAQHLPTGFETSLPYAARSSRFGSELPSVEDDVDIWCSAVSELHARNDDDDC